MVIENYKKEFFLIWKNTTICLLTLDNWYEVIWESHKLPETEYNKEIWEAVAFEDAFGKLEELMAFSSYLNK